MQYYNRFDFPILWFGFGWNFVKKNGISFWVFFKLSMCDMVVFNVLSTEFNEEL